MKATYLEDVYSLHEELLDLLNVNQILTNDYYYQKRQVVMIDDLQRDVVIKNSKDYERSRIGVVKVEGIERHSLEVYNELCFIEDIVSPKELSNFITAHLFVSPKDGLSFPPHTDPVDVILVMLKGSKMLLVENQDTKETETFILKPGDILHIPKDTIHFALNTNDSIMISIGLEYYHETQMRKQSK